MSDDPAPGADPASPPAPPTGHARVDAVLDRAAELELLPVAEHPARYEELHAALVAELSAEPGTVPAGLPPDEGPGSGQNGQGASAPR